MKKNHLKRLSLKYEMRISWQKGLKISWNWRSQFETMSNPSISTPSSNRPGPKLPLTTIDSHNPWIFQPKKLLQVFRLVSVINGDWWCSIVSGWGMKREEMVREPIFHTCTVLFFLIILFLSRCYSVFFEYAVCNIKPTLFVEEKIEHFMHKHRQKPTRLTQVSVSISTKKKPAFFAKKIFFVQFSRASAMMIFIRFFFLFLLQHFNINMCVSFSAATVPTEKKTSPQLCALRNRKKAKSVKELNFY